MSEQPLDLRRSLQILRRHLTAIGIVAAVGLLAGAGYTAAFNLPMHASEALVVLPASMNNTAAQVVIANSTPVLSGALPSVHPAVSLQTMQSRVQVTSVGSDVLSVSAKSGTDAQAESMANAVADSYIAYVGAADAPLGQVPAQILTAATNATATQLPVRMLAAAIIGTLAGLGVGAVGALAIGRGSQRLRDRDEIADAIGVPVLASIPVTRPTGQAGWTKLLEKYEPGVAETYRLRNALNDLGLAGVTSAAGRPGRSSLTVLTLASDPSAFALGPQLAVFAASLGIPTALVLGPQEDSTTAAALRDAAVALSSPGSSPGSSSRRSGQLRIVTGHDDLDQPPDTVLNVVVTVVDDRTPRPASPMRTSATLLGVSAGATTPGQLARVAASAAANGRRITGILVANPDPADPTTGRLPRLARPTQGRMPTRLTGTLR